MASFSPSLLKSLSSLSLSAALAPATPPSEFSPPHSLPSLSSKLPTRLKIDESHLLSPVILKESGFQFCSDDVLSVVCPSVLYSETLFFKSGYNVQVIVTNQQEPEESLIGRFRREVFRAGIIQETKRRARFETNQEKRKRKIKEAARRNRKRRPRPPKVVKENRKKDAVSDEVDNWEFIDVELPYCKNL